MSFLTYLFGKGFKGGPDFNLNQTHTVNLNGIQLEVTLPETNLMVAPSPNIQDFPFKQEGWFDQHSRQLWNHHYVELNIGCPWFYTGPFWKVLNEPFGSLSFQAHLKRTLPGCSLEFGNLDSLKKAIEWDYKEHFEAPEEGKYGRGINTKAIADAKIRFKDPFWHNEAGKKQLEAFLRNRMRELPETFETREYGTEKWLYYSLKREPNYPTHHYCQILDEHFYLDIYFHYRIDFRKYFPIWKDHAEAAEQRIMESVRLHFPDRLQEAQEFIPKE